MSMGSVNNAGHVSPLVQTHGAQGAAPTTFGPHTVTTGALPSGPPATGRFGAGAKAFFQGLGDKFASLRSGAASLPGRVGDKYDAWQLTKTAQKVVKWNAEPANLESKHATKSTQANSGDQALKNIMTANKEFGSNGVHQMAGRMLDKFKEQAQANIQSGKQPQTWQACAKQSFTNDLVKTGTYKQAGEKIDSLSKHFSIYTKLGVEPEREEMGRILTDLRAQVTDAAGFEQDARAAFSAEIDGEMGKLNNFFRANTDATVNTATLLRNANGKQNAQVLEAFMDVFSSSKNKKDVAIVNTIDTKSGAKPTMAQQDAVNNLTQQFLERAFDLSRDGGAAFAQNLDPTVRSFLSDTCQEIADKTNLPAADRNEGIRKWFSGGMGLRDFGSTASNAVQGTKNEKVGLLVATNAVRIFGDVADSDATRSKLGEGAASYSAFHTQVGPQFAAFLTRLGMPTAV